MANKIQYHPTLEDVFSPLKAKSGAKISPKSAKKSTNFSQNFKRKGDSGLDIDPDGNPIQKRATYNPSLEPIGKGPSDIGDQFGNINIPQPPAPNHPWAQGANALVGGAAAIDALIPYGKIRRQQVVRPPFAQSQHPYGTGSQAIMKEGGYVPFNPPFNNIIANQVAEDKGGAPHHYYHADDDYYENGGGIPQYGGYEEPVPSQAVNADNKVNLKVFKDGGEVNNKDNLLVFDNGGLVGDEGDNKLVFKDGGRAKYGYRMHQDPTRNRPTFDDGGYIGKLNSKGKVIPNILNSGDAISPEQRRSDRPYNQMTYYGADFVADSGVKISKEQAKWDYPYTQMSYDQGGIIPSSYGKDEDVNKLVFAGGGAVGGSPAGGGGGVGLSSAPGLSGHMAAKVGNGLAGPTKRKKHKGMESGGRMIAGGLGGPGKTYRKGKYADSFDDSKLLTAEYDDGGPVDPNKPVSQMTDAEVHTALYKPIYVPGDILSVQDKRKVNPATGQPFRNVGGKSTNVNSNVLKIIGQQARAKGVDPNEAAAIALQESEFGNADIRRAIGPINAYRKDPKRQATDDQINEMQNNQIDESYRGMAHAWSTFSDKGITGGYTPVLEGANALAKALQEKNRYAHQLGMDQKGDAFRLQTYNGLGVVKPASGMRGFSMYGIPIDRDHPLDMRKNPAYGKTVVSLRDQVLKPNPAVQQALNAPSQYLQIMDDGGPVDVNKVIPHSLKFNYGGNAEVTSNNPYAGPTIEFKGPSHEDGGIGMSYGDKKVEVEGGETGVVDQDGDLNVMGNMVYPGTSTKFKSISKKIASQENSADRKFKKGNTLMDNNDQNDNYEALANNSGKALILGANMKMKKLAEAREQIADLQKVMLDRADGLGIDPQEFSQGKYVKAKNGIRVADNGDVLGMPDDTPPKKKKKPGNDTTRNAPNDASVAPQPDTPIAYNKKAPVINRFAGNYFQEKGDDTPLPNLQGDGPAIPSSATKLNPTQIAPEIYSLATNHEIPVPTQRFTPQLLQPYSVSFQDRINENRDTFNSMARQLDYNPSALSALGAQKYSADNAVRGEEFRTNQSISQDIANKNVSIINDANLKNLQLADQQMVRQAQARAKTKAQTQEALNSVASKILQHSLENRKLQLYEGMFDYRFKDTDGDGVPDALTYEGGPHQFDYSGQGSSNQNGLGANQRQTVTRDADGNVKSSRTTSNPSIDYNLKSLKLIKENRSLYNTGNQ